MPSRDWRCMSLQSWRKALLWKIVLFLVGGTSTPLWAQRTELPVRLVDLPNGDRRFATTIIIDGQPTEVGIDTGSTGLRALSRGLSSDAASIKGPKVSYSYGVGTAFQGEAITRQVSAGAVSGAVKLMRVDVVGCSAEHPQCPIVHADLAHYGIQGDGIAGQGFVAILGIRLKRDEVDNPFLQLGVRRWIVDLPRSAAEQGRIVLNPDDVETAGYARIGIDADGTTPGCLVGPQKVCGRAFFDSGAAGLRVISETAFRVWANGTPAMINLGVGQDQQSMSVTVGRRDQASGLLYVAGRSDTRLSLGFAPYFHWSVLYDPDRRQIGLKLR